jgi:hypothetical protein
MPDPGDPRAWDVFVRGGGVTIGVEIETRITDLQELERRLMLKARDSRVDRVILVLKDTRHHRHVVRAWGESLRTSFPISGRSAIAALRDGRDPGGNALLLL